MQMRPAEPRCAPGLARRLVAEGIGTALLLATVVGSGSMAEELSAGNRGLALLANSFATGAGLVALILALGPISGAHLNPAVTLVDAWLAGISWREAAAYIAFQVGCAFAGVALAHGMFGMQLFSASEHARGGFSQLLSEFVATAGLVFVIRSCTHNRPRVTPFAVGAYIAAAYWFTASTCFANPAATLARAATNTFAGIRPVDAPGFLVAQLIGAGCATALLRWLLPRHAEGRALVLSDERAPRVEA
jgi:glycerol uptake facilitator-like aquaporin